MRSTSAPSFGAGISAEAIAPLAKPPSLSVSIAVIALAVVLTASTITSARADDFYKGRQVVIICGFAPGGVGVHASASTSRRSFGR